jgi:hypothetical protein
VPRHERKTLNLLAVDQSLEKLQHVIRPGPMKARAGAGDLTDDCAVGVADRGFDPGEHITS